MAAHATATNANASAHQAQGAAQGAGSGDDGTLFADLLAKGNDAGTADTKDASDPKDATAPSKAGGKSRKATDDTSDILARFVEMQALPQHMAALNAKFAATNGIPKPKSDDSDDAVKAADAPDAVSDATQVPDPAQDKKADATDKTAPAKDAGKKAAFHDVVAAQAKSDAAAATNVAAATVPVKGPAQPEKTVHRKDIKAEAAQPADAAAAATAAVNAALPADATTVTTSGDATNAIKIDDASAIKADDAKNNAAQDAQAPASDRAATLAAVADKSIRDGAKAQSVETRALPVRLEAQVAASRDDNSDNKGGKAGDDSANTKDAVPSLHAKPDEDVQPHQDEIQSAAAQSASNAANTTAPAPHAQEQATNVQSVNAQAQAQTAAQAPAQAQPLVTASVQVAQQNAAQAASGPDIGALAVQIAAKSSEGAKHFDIRLDPPELGRVDVKLSIDSTGQAQAHLTVEKPQTLDLMQRDRGDLERALRNSGVDLSQNGLNFSLKGQERQGGDNSTPFRGRNQNLVATAAIESVSAAVAASANSFAAGDTRLDIRV